jgi:hypothetical protein
MDTNPVLLDDNLNTFSRMKSMRFLIMMMVLCSFNLYAQTPEIDDLSKGDLKDIATEFSANFAHTTVSAPHTKGIFGFEVGLIAGLTNTSKLADLVKEQGGESDDFKRMPHAGLMARVHIPMQFFVEATMLPKFEVSDVEVSNMSLGGGWNMGRFLNWPLDVSFAVEMSKSELGYEQVINNTSTGNTDVNADISFKSSTTTYWVGFSKRFIFVTPYLKVGGAKMDSDIEIDTAGGTGTIFAFSTGQSASADNTGGYFAVGANIHLLFMNLGFEASKIMDIGRATGKLSFEF